MADAATSETLDDGPGIIGLAAIAAGFSVPLSYPAVGIIREVIGGRGIALSPLIIAPLVLLAFIPLMYLEPAIQRLSAWSRIQRFWYGGFILLGLGVPILVGVLWPVPVLTELPRIVPGLLCFFAPPIVLTLVPAFARRRRGDG